MVKPRTPVIHVQHREPCDCFQVGRSEGPCLVCPCGAAFQLKAVAEYDFWRCPDCHAQADMTHVRQMASSAA